MSNLENLLKDKTVEDFTREQLEQMANDHGVSFKETNKDETIFKKLVASFSEENNDVELVKVKFLLSPSGKFLLPYSVGEEVELPEPLATELIEAKYAEKV
ncbi:hypothetical protein MHM83_10945 [Tenacibaculum sp. Mcav3-52]|uniref:hypothetical protein n=1 Tax=Tenacibaculum sp. Mcav3-52 TaxID=2917762 RepID=UPI001EF31D83|nr:hypothetical protein [Tenacibaculum sp. Mcav3-52]MCG7502389.1 hypothetical protein [Tenacibaculum sp. Mcav3-52]